MSDDDGENAGFDGLAKILTPILWLEKAIVWWHNWRKPDDTEEL